MAKPLADICAGRRVLIYAWLDPDTGKPVYVGKTSAGIKARMRNHRREALQGSPTRKHVWLRGVLEEGKTVGIAELEWCDVANSARVEAEWLTKLGGCGVLLNQVAAGCGNPGVGRVKWMPDKIALLGTASDERVAEILGCNRATVSYRRNVHGIARYPVQSPPNIINLPEAVIDRLGTVPDYQLAAEIGVSKWVVAEARRDRGIPSYAKATGNDGRIKTGDPHRLWDSPIADDEKYRKRPRAKPHAAPSLRSKPGRNNSSGVTGVYWTRNVGKWLAAICRDGKLVNLGYFADKEDAIAARKAAEAEKYSAS